jgi:hypothetical protein
LATFSGKFSDERAATKERYATQARSEYRRLAEGQGDEADHNFQLGLHLNMRQREGCASST